MVGGIFSYLGLRERKSGWWCRSVVGGLPNGSNLGSLAGPVYADSSWRLCVYEDEEIPLLKVQRSTSGMKAS